LLSQQCQNEHIFAKHLELGKRANYWSHKRSCRQDNEAACTQWWACERNKVIRIWEDHSKREDKNMNHCLEEDMLSCSSPTSIRSHFNKATLNPAEEFFHNYHIELDPSLTPKYINMARIASSTTIIPSYDKTPITNLLKAPGFSSVL